MKALVKNQKKHVRCSKIYYCFFESNFGTMLLAAKDDKICHVSFVTNEILKNKSSASEKERALESLKSFVGDSTNQVFLKKKCPVLLSAIRVISGKTEKTPPLELQGTSFQVRVWKLLARIPRGSTCNYKDIAQKAGCPRAVRAVGNAIGANTIALLIPCHRVIQSGGGVGGYRWGTDRKIKIIDSEK